MDFLCSCWAIRGYATGFFTFKQICTYVFTFLYYYGLIMAQAWAETSCCLINVFLKVC